MTCPRCGKEMENGALYVRGMGASLFWSLKQDVRWFSRRDLTQIDLGLVSLTGTGAQAVLESWRCNCGLVSFNGGA